jgi:hypothetical protein
MWLISVFDVQIPLRLFDILMGKAGISGKERWGKHFTRRVAPLKKVTEIVFSVVP